MIDKTREEPREIPPGEHGRKKAASKDGDSSQSRVADETAELHAQSQMMMTGRHLNVFDVFCFLVLSVVEIATTHVVGVKEVLSLFVCSGMIMSASNILSYAPLRRYFKSKGLQYGKYLYVEHNRWLG
jgi:hypothetical protein